MGAPQYEQAGADIAGTGTVNYLAKWTAGSTLSDSIIIQGATNNAVGIGNAPTTDLAGYKALEVGGLGSGFVNADNDMWITANAKHSGGGWKYAVAASTPSNAIRANTGAIIFNRAGNGTGGNALTWIESARIDSSGNFGLGTATPQELAQVAGNLKIGTTATNSFLTFGDEGTTSRFNGIYRPASSNTLSVGSYNLITFNVSAAALGSQTERARIDSSGNLILNAANTGATIQAAGSQQGLKLPATPGNADTQTLDCYAEGNLSSGFTIVGITSGGAITTSVSWTRVGRTISYTVQIQPAAGQSLTFANPWYVVGIGAPAPGETSAGSIISGNGTISASGQVYASGANPVFYAFAAGALAANERLYFSARATQ